jgi:hypothetical protein
MIDKREILEAASSLSLLPNVVEKDYVLGWLRAATPCMLRNHKRSLRSSKRRQPVPWWQRKKKTQRLPLQTRFKRHPQLESRGEDFVHRMIYACWDSLPRRFQPHTPRTQLDAVPELSCARQFIDDLSST